MIFLITFESYVFSPIVNFIENFLFLFVPPNCNRTHRDIMASYFVHLNNPWMSVITLSHCSVVTILAFLGLISILFALFSASSNKVSIWGPTFFSEIFTAASGGVLAFYLTDDLGVIFIKKKIIFKDLTST